MRCRPTTPHRRGATLVEFAVICPLMFLLLFGLLIGGMGIFRYQQVAALAREGARWASVRGGQYAAENAGVTAATSESVYNEVILPKAVSLQPELLSCNVTWNGGNMPSQVVADNGRAVTGTVRVTITYQWIPEGIFSSVNLTSTAVMPIHY
jgi:Flp pilus assembly protein TadG